MYCGYTGILTLLTGTKFTTLHYAYVTTIYNYNVPLFCFYFYLYVSYLGHMKSNIQNKKSCFM